MPSKQAIQRIVDDFARSGLTRRAFCEQHNIPITTLDYWRRAKRRSPRLIAIEVESLEPSTGFALVLANGRRIESSWQFQQSDLERLIRAAEA
jgi:hypothetical protein